MLRSFILFVCILTVAGCSLKKTVEPVVVKVKNRTLASGGRSSNIIDSNNRSIETINFAKKRALLIDVPKFDCPLELIKNPICFHSGENKRSNLVLDPGHDLSINSHRNGRHDQINEGRANMSVAVLARLMLRQCAPYIKETQTGIMADNIFLSHYPGESYYGDFEFGPALSRNRASNKISSLGGAALFNHVNNLLRLNDGAPQRGVVISVHADAPDFLADSKRYSEYPAVFFRRTRKNSAALAMSLYESMIEQTSTYYSKDLREIFEIKPESGREYYPKLTLLGVPKGSSIETEEIYSVNNESVQMRIWKRELALILRAGLGDKYVETGGINPRTFYMGHLDIASNKTEVALVEGFFMDSLGLGKKIQKELSSDTTPMIKFKSAFDSINNLKDVKFKKAKINLLKPTSTAIRYRITDAGPVDDGLKISSFYMDYARAIVLGLQKRYSCN